MNSGGRAYVSPLANGGKQSMNKTNAILIRGRNTDSIPGLAMRSLLSKRAILVADRLVMDFWS